MLEQEIIELFNVRHLNAKTNNYIFSGIDDFIILDSIPDECSISINDNEDNLDIQVANNIKIDLAEVKIEEILYYVLEVLKESLTLDVILDNTLYLKNKFKLFTFQRILRDYNVITQLVFYNLDKLSLEEHMLFNELYYFYSIYFNCNSFIKENNFQTYFLNNDRVLDYRENYSKIKLFKTENYKI